MDAAQRKLLVDMRLAAGGARHEKHGLLDAELVMSTLTSNPFVGLVSVADAHELDSHGIVHEFKGLDPEHAALGEVVVHMCASLRDLRNGTRGGEQ